MQLVNCQSCCNFDMGDKIAQSDRDRENSFDANRRDQQTLAAVDTIKSRHGNDEKTQETESMEMVSSFPTTCSCTTTTTTKLGSEVRRARRRRQRGRKLHKHRLSKQRRDGRAKRSLLLIGAPRNDNEFLMSQYNEGLNPPHLQTQDICQSCSPFTPRDIATCRSLYLSPSHSVISSLDGASFSSDSPSPSSDYSSLPSSPADENGNRGYRYDGELFPASSQPMNLELEGVRNVLMDGTDANFLQRNFEEEYTDNITRSLQDSTRDELIIKCMALMEKLRDLEHKKYSRAASSINASTTTVLEIKLQSRANLTP